jgi:transcriptional regulator with XRE-family HTH domain
VILYFHKEEAPMEEIQRMQDNLLLIRRTIGWTAAEFGDQIGVTRQTINNIESGRNKLTKTQYIAMRSVIDAELVKHPEETQMVKTLLDMLVDHPENYSKTDYNELLEKANLMSPSILAGTATRETVSKEWMKAAGAIGAVVASTVAVPLTGAPIVGAVVGGWLAKAVKTTDKKKRDEK